VKRKLPEETNVNILAGREEESSSRWREGKEEYKKKRGEERRGEERREREREREQEKDLRSAGITCRIIPFIPRARGSCVRRATLSRHSQLSRETTRRIDRWRKIEEDSSGDIVFRKGRKARKVDDAGPLGDVYFRAAPLREAWSHLESHCGLFFRDWRCHDSLPRPTGHRPFQYQ